MSETPWRRDRGLSAIVKSTQVDSRSLCVHVPRNLPSTGSCRRPPSAGPAGWPPLRLQGEQPHRIAETTSFGERWRETLEGTTAQAGALPPAASAFALFGKLEIRIGCAALADLQWDCPWFVLTIQLPLLRRPPVLSHGRSRRPLLRPHHQQRRKAEPGNGGTAGKVSADLAASSTYVCRRLCR